MTSSEIINNYFYTDMTKRLDTNNTLVNHWVEQIKGLNQRDCFDLTIQLLENSRNPIIHSSLIIQALEQREANMFTILLLNAIGVAELAFSRLLLTNLKRLSKGESMFKLEDLYTQSWKRELGTGRPKFPKAPFASLSQPSEPEPTNSDVEPIKVGQIKTTIEIPLGSQIFTEQYETTLKAFGILTDILKDNTYGFLIPQPFLSKKIAALTKLNNIRRTLLSDGFRKYHKNTIMPQKPRIPTMIVVDALRNLERISQVFGVKMCVQKFKQNAEMLKQAKVIHRFMSKHYEQRMKRAINILRNLPDSKEYTKKEESSNEKHE